MYRIMYSEEEINSLLERIKGTLSKTRNNSDKIEITEKRVKYEEKATICFTPTAFVKQWALVNGFDTEVEWHALSRRISPTEFEIYDILVFPHTVSAATVVSDQKEYEEWLDSLDDETFNDLRVHGHSHVRMSTSPSGFDMTYRDKVVSQLPTASENNDVFYIFYILNKNGQWTAQIYDMTNNAMYDSKYNDIEIDVLFDDGTYRSEFVENAKKIAKTAPAAAQKGSVLTPSQIAKGVVASDNEIKKYKSSNYADKEKDYGDKYKKYRDDIYESDYERFRYGWD